MPKAKTSGYEKNNHHGAEEVVSFRRPTAIMSATFDFLLLAARVSHQRKVFPYSFNHLIKIKLPLII